MLTCLFDNEKLNIEKTDMILGASASGALMMILPPLFYLKINNEPLKGNRQKQIAFGFLIFGVAFSTMTLGIMVFAKLSG